MVEGKSDVCTTSFEYIVFEQVAMDIAEANNWKVAESPLHAEKMGCKKLIIVDNVNPRVSVISSIYKNRVKNAKVYLYGTTEGRLSSDPNIIKGMPPIIAPSKFSKEWIEEAGFNVIAVIPHGIKYFNINTDKNENFLYRAYYIKRKLPPYGIIAVKKARENGLNFVLQIRDDLYPKGLEPRHATLKNLLDFEIVSAKTQREKALEEIAKAKAFVNLSDGGGFELEVLESMALGTPVITPYYPPISEYYPKNELTVETKETWYEPYPDIAIEHHVYDPEEIVEKMKMVNTWSKEKYESVREELRKIALEYDYKKVYVKFSKII